MSGAVVSGSTSGSEGQPGRDCGTGDFIDLGSPEVGARPAQSLFEARAAIEHLNYLYADHCESGFLAMAFGSGWNPVTKRHSRFRQAFYEWPHDIDTMVAAAEAGVRRGEDIYLCSHLRLAQERRKATGSPLGNIAWADLDDDTEDRTVTCRDDAGGDQAA